jgi:hypothetical protein
MAGESFEVRLVGNIGAAFDNDAGDTCVERERAKEEGGHAVEHADIIIGLFGSGFSSVAWGWERPIGADNAN